MAGPVTERTLRDRLRPALAEALVSNAP